MFPLLPSPLGFCASSGLIQVVATTAQHSTAQHSAPFLALLKHSGLLPGQVFNVPGRCFPVDIIHSTDDHMQDYAAAAVDTALQLHLNQPPGGLHETMMVTVMCRQQL
jgi:hypothetical protein